MKKNATFIILSIGIFLVWNAKAQPSQDLVNRMMPRPVPASPNVASLGKFGDYQVSHFSGLPQISIPIYEVKSGNLSLPITLSYHAGGVKPTDVAGWVGLGWSLSAGGQISRTVNNKNDEEGYLAKGSGLSTFLKNDHARSRLLSPKCWCSFEKLALSSGPFAAAGFLFLLRSYFQFAQ